jgi:hypothetical protein
VVSTPGLIVAGHGALVGGAAHADAAYFGVKLIRLQNLLKSTSHQPASQTPQETKAPPAKKQQVLKEVNGRKYLRDFKTKNTKEWSAYYKSERQARNVSRQKLGKNPIEVEPNKWRSADGKWQYRAKPGDVKENHIHLEELNPETGEVIQNLHLRWR